MQVRRLEAEILTGLENWNLSSSSALLLSKCQTWSANSRTMATIWSSPSSLIMIIMFMSYCSKTPTLPSVLVSSLTLLENYFVRMSITGGTPRSRRTSPITPIRGGSIGRRRVGDGVRTQCSTPGGRLRHPEAGAPGGGGNHGIMLTSWPPTQSTMKPPVANPRRRLVRTQPLSSQHHYRWGVVRKRRRVLRRRLAFIMAIGKFVIGLGRGRQTMHGGYSVRRRFACIMDSWTTSSLCPAAPCASFSLSIFLSRRS